MVFFFSNINSNMLVSLFNAHKKNPTDIVYFSTSLHTTAQHIRQKR